MSRQSSVLITGEQKQILDNTHFVSVNYKIAKTDVTAQLSSNVLLAGTILAGKGVVLNDVDFTNSHGTETVPVVQHGWVRTAAMPVAPTAGDKTAFPMIMFV